MLGTSLFRGLISSAIATLLAGCAAVAPLTSALTGAAPTVGLEVHSETAVKLQEANFVTVRTNVVGISKGFKLLGFITISPATLNTAMNRLYARAEAEQGRPQTLANLIVEKSGVYVILFSIPQVTVRADLVEFIPVNDEEDQTSPKDGGMQRVNRKAPSGIRNARRASEE
jgi:hypothetical protein